MFERHHSPRPRRFERILPWLWIIGPAYLVALAIAFLSESGASGGHGFIGVLLATN